MNTEVYSFTGTGNSYIVTKDIAYRLQGNLITVKDTSVQSGDKTFKRTRYHHPDVTLKEMIRKKE